MPSVKVTLKIVSHDSFSTHSPARFGVGEELKLSVAFADSKQTAASVGGLEWKVKSGPAIVKADVGNGNATLKCGGADGTVELELRLKTGSKELLGSKKFVIVEPASATFVQKGADFHIQGMASAGFQGEIMLHPDDVSFKWVEIREGGASYSGSGCFELKNVEIRKGKPDKVGKLVATDTDGQVSKGSYAVIHPIMGEWVGFGKATGKGTKCVGADTVLNALPTWGTGGEMSWAIPWYFRVPGSAEKRFMTATHEATVDAAGKCTISKLGHTVTRNLNDGDSNTGIAN